MTHLDLSGVTPLRWQEVRRRVSALEGYLSLSRPSPSDRAIAANSVDLSLNRFDRLLASWRIHRDPARLEGAGQLCRTRRSRHDGLAKEVKAIMSRAIAVMGPEATLKEVYARVRGECEDQGLQPPARNHVWARLMDERSLAGPLRGCEPEILVGRAWAEIPVLLPRRSQTLTRPEMILAVSLPERTVMGHASDLLLGRPPRLEDLGLAGTGRSPLRVARRDMGVPDAGVAGIEIDDGANARLARVLGRAIGEIDLSFRLPRTPADRLLGSKLDRPLDTDDARLAIEFAIDRHNKRVGGIVS